MQIPDLTDHEEAAQEYPITCLRCGPAGSSRYWKQVADSGIPVGDDMGPIRLWRRLRRRLSRVDKY